MEDITTLLKSTNVSGYLYAVETQADWLSFRDPKYAANSAPGFEQRFNKKDQIAYYIASGENTAKLNVPDWEKKLRCQVTPQTLNCFDLPRFSKDFGIYEDFLRSKEEGGYPLPQATADILLKDYGVTGILYTSVADYYSGSAGFCIVIRSQDGKFVNENFFVTGCAS